MANYDVESHRHPWYRKMFLFFYFWHPMLVRPAMKRLFCLKAKNGLGRFAPSALPHYKKRYNIYRLFTGLFQTSQFFGFRRCLWKNPEITAQLFFPSGCNGLRYPLLEVSLHFGYVRQLFPPGYFHIVCRPKDDRRCRGVRRDF